MRRSGLATTSGSAGTGPGNDTGVWLIITIILFALLCNYSRTICLIDVGTEGDAKDFRWRQMACEREKRVTLEPLYRVAKTLMPKLGISQQNVLYYASLA